MERAEKYTTCNRVRLTLFTHSYACYSIAQHLRAKYKIDDKLTSTELRRKHFNKKAIPEISRLSRVLNFDYKLLWQTIVLNKNHTLGKRISSEEGMRIYLFIENELITLAASKRNRSNFFDPDYESESALLSIAIERAAGNKLINIEDDSVFEHQQEILQKLYLRWYYKVAYKYKLPTTRIVPFVLRLIS